MSSLAAQFLNTFASTAAVTPPLIAGYSLGPVIGYGSTSVIRKAYDPTGSVAAVKIISSSLKHHLREASVWSLLSHQHILPLFAFHHSISHLYFFTLYCPAGSLLDVLKSLGSPALLQDDAGMIFRQLVRGLRYLHEDAKFVHRDIKLENVLVDEMGVCRIADFGLAVRIVDPDSQHAPASLSCSDDEDEDVHHQLGSHPGPRYHRNSTSTHSLLSLHHHIHQNHFQPGSLPYAAPELLVPRPIDLHSLRPNSHSRPHPSQDIWALGVLLYALLTGSLPFFDPFEPRLQLKILNGSYLPPQDIGLGAERILKGCLDKNILTRWTAAMVDDVAWGVGWGREGDGAGAADIEEDDPQGPEDSLRPGEWDLQINTATFGHRDHHVPATAFTLLSPSPRTASPEKKRRARSKSLGASLSRSLSPSPSYRFPPSPSSRSPSTSPSPARSSSSPTSLSPLGLHSESGHDETIEPDIEIVSSPKSLVSDFDRVRTDEDAPGLGEISRGRKMRSLPLPRQNLRQRQVISGHVPPRLCRCDYPHHHNVEEEEEEEEDGLSLSLRFERSTRLP